MIESYTVTRDVPSKMRDGVVLRADIWRPAVEGRAPAILFRTPYDKRTLNPEFLRPQQCVEAGFAAVVQDTRGRFASAGDWRPIMWEQEGLDTYDTVEWVADQDWCSGAVGMSGPSYLGITQLAGALLRPPHLKAIAPALAGAWQFEQIETGGAFRLDHVISWVAFMGGDWLQRRRAKGLPISVEQAEVVAHALRNPRWLMDHRPLRDIPLFALPDFPITFDDLVQGRNSAGVDPSSIDIPTLNIGGWYDVFTRTSVGAFAAQSRVGLAPSHLLMGCWTHSGQLPQQHGQVNFGLFAAGGAAGVAERHLQFFRRYLAGDAVDVPAVRYFLMNANLWRDAPTWPPPGSKPSRLYLDGASRGLAARPPSDEPPPSEYVYDPDDPTPTRGGRVLYLGGLAMGPIDQSPLHRRNDVLVFVGDPTETPVDLIGPVSVQLHVSSSAPDTDFIVKLLDLDPEGVALPIVEGALRMRWRDGFSSEKPLTADVAEPVMIDLGDTAWRLAAGHRLGLQVQSANYPHLDPNMNTGGSVGAEARGVIARNRLYHGAARPSWVEVSILDVES